MWKRLRYRFDNLMARGVGAQILLLAVATALLVAVTVLAVPASPWLPIALTFVEACLGPTSPS